MDGNKSDLDEGIGALGLLLGQPRGSPLHFGPNGQGRKQWRGQGPAFAFAAASSALWSGSAPRPCQAGSIIRLYPPFGPSQLGGRRTRHNGAAKGVEGNWKGKEPANSREGTHWGFGLDLGQPIGAVKKQRT